MRLVIHLARRAYFETPGVHVYTLPPRLRARALMTRVVRASKVDFALCVRCESCCSKITREERDRERTRNITAYVCMCTRMYAYTCSEDFHLSPARPGPPIQLYTVPAPTPPPPPLGQSYERPPQVVCMSEWERETMTQCTCIRRSGCIDFSPARMHIGMYMYVEAKTHVCPGRAKINWTR